ncbi:MAG TPA: DUF3047 domain-containing protein [Candidatus Tectomicrobia bacterium]|nr:DUF3047 domain-containing protein [Candidatus Tectomicrobia bacterium]
MRTLCRDVVTIVLSAATVAVAPVARHPATAQQSTTPQRSPAARQHCVLLEDFAGSPVGQFPAGWRVRDDEGMAVYTVQEEGGLRFLHALSRGLGIQAGKAHEWDLNEYPVLAWSWRPRAFPEGADERTDRNDSVLAVYVLVPHSRVRGPKAVKYVWSERVPAGTHLTSNRGLTQVRVLRSGRAGLGAWREERVNAREDYVRFFEEKRAPRAAGIAVLTDADDTRSTAAGDYADFRLCRG